MNKESWRTIYYYFSLLNIDLETAKEMVESAVPLWTRYSILSNNIIIKHSCSQAIESTVVPPRFSKNNYGRSNDWSKADRKDCIIIDGHSNRKGLSVGGMTPEQLGKELKEVYLKQIGALIFYGCNLGYSEFDEVLRLCLLAQNISFGYIKTYKGIVRIRDECHPGISVMDEKHRRRIFNKYKLLYGDIPRRQVGLRNFF